MLEGLAVFFGVVVGIDDGSHQRMAHHVSLAEVVHGKTGDLVQDGQGMDEARAGPPGRRVFGW